MAYNKIMVRKNMEKNIDVLRRVDEDEAFWLCSNVIVHSLEELAFELSRVEDNVFRYHIHRNRNDFEEWIRDCIGDKELARDIARVKTRDTLAKKIEARLDVLKSRNQSPTKRAIKLSSHYNRIGKVKSKTR